MECEIISNKKVEKSQNDSKTKIMWSEVPIVYELFKQLEVVSDACFEQSEEDNHRWLLELPLLLPLSSIVYCIQDWLVIRRTSKEMDSDRSNSSLAASGRFSTVDVPVLFRKFCIELNSSEYKTFTSSPPRIIRWEWWHATFLKSLDFLMLSTTPYMFL